MYLNSKINLIKALAVLSQKLKSVETQDEAWSDDDDKKPSKEKETAVTIDNEPTNNAQSVDPVTDE